MPKSLLTKNKLSLTFLTLIIFGLNIFYPNKTSANTLSISQNNQSGAPVLDYIAINNTVIEESRSEKVHVVEGDAVKIAGQAQPGAKITIFFGDRQLETAVDKYGNWFVLFSVLNLEDGFYEIKAKLEKDENFSSLTTSETGEDEKEVVLNTLTLGEDYREIETEDGKNKALATPTGWLGNIKNKVLISYLIIGILSIGAVVGIVFLSKNKKFKDKFNKIKKDLLAKMKK
jgi:hypothetical protein